MRVTWAFALKSYLLGNMPNCNTKPGCNLTGQQVYQQKWKDVTTKQRHLHHCSCLGQSWALLKHFVSISCGLWYHVIQTGRPTRRAAPAPSCHCFTWSVLEQLFLNQHLRLANCQTSQSVNIKRKMPTEEFFVKYSRQIQNGTFVENDWGRHQRKSGHVAPGVKSSADCVRHGIPRYKYVAS